MQGTWDGYWQAEPDNRKTGLMSTVRLLRPSRAKLSRPQQRQKKENDHTEQGALLFVIRNGLLRNLIIARTQSSHRNAEIRQKMLSQIDISRRKIRRSWVHIRCKIRGPSYLTLFNFPCCVVREDRTKRNRAILPCSWICGILLQQRGSRLNEGQQHCSISLSNRASSG